MRVNIHNSLFAASQGNLVPLANLQLHVTIIQGKEVNHFYSSSD